MADILIPKVDLPKNQDFIVITVLSDGFAKIETVKDNCIEMRTSKAIELPPHGDLKDANELEKAAEKMAVCDSYEYTIAHEMVKKLLEIAPTVLEASNKTETPREARICPYYQGVCGLDEDIICYCSSSYEMCDKYRKASN